MKTRSETETMSLAARLAKTLKAGDILALAGELGSGKTCFVKGLAQGLGVPKNVCVSSPTFVLLHEYRGGRLPLYHFDFYRLEREGGLAGLNVEEYWEGEGVSVVEWADKFVQIFPARTRWIRFQFVDETVREILC